MSTHCDMNPILREKEWKTETGTSIKQDSRTEYTNMYAPLVIPIS